MADTTRTQEHPVQVGLCGRQVPPREMQALHRLSQSEDPYTARRARALYRMAQGEPRVAIARDAGIHRVTLYQWLQLYESRRVNRYSVEAAVAVHMNHAEGYRGTPQQVAGKLLKKRKDWTPAEFRAALAAAGHTVSRTTAWRLQHRVNS